MREVSVSVGRQCGYRSVLKGVRVDGGRRDHGSMKEARLVHCK